MNEEIVHAQSQMDEASVPGSARAPDAPLYGGFWRRGAASSVDSLILFVPNFAAAMLVDDVYLGLSIDILFGWAYFALFHSSRLQATPGKIAFGIKVGDLGGSRIGFGRATGRYFATFLSALILLIGYLMAAFTKRRQALHDMIAGTLVVRTRATPEEVAAGGKVMPISPGTGVLVAFLVSLPFFVGAIAVVAIPAWQSHARQEILASARLNGKANSTQAEEKISYAIYSRPLFKREMEAVGEGTRGYAHSEVQTSPGPAPNVPNSSKSLAITDEFEIWASIYREPRVEGFGLYLRKNGQGFSWEWFYRESEDVFLKLQGGGRVKVRFANIDGMEELAEVEFLDDIALRLDRFWLVPFTGDESDRLIVRKGSVLWLSP